MAVIYSEGFGLLFSFLLTIVVLLIAQTVTSVEPVRANHRPEKSFRVLSTGKREKTF